MGVIEPGFGGQGVVAEGLSVGAPPGPEMDGVMSWIPCLVRSTDRSGEERVVLGHRLVDDHPEFLAARCRPNTVIAASSDLKIFFELFPKDPTLVSTAATALTKSLEATVTTPSTPAKATTPSVGYAVPTTSTVAPVPTRSTEVVVLTPSTETAATTSCTVAEGVTSSTAAAVVTPLSEAEATTHADESKMPPPASAFTGNRRCFSSTPTLASFKHTLASEASLNETQVRESKGRWSWHGSLGTCNHLDSCCARFARLRRSITEGTGARSRRWTLRGHRGARGLRTRVSKP